MQVIVDANSHLRYFARISSLESCESMAFSVQPTNSRLLAGRTELCALTPFQRGRERWQIRTEGERCHARTRTLRPCFFSPKVRTDPVVFRYNGGSCERIKISDLFSPERTFLRDESTIGSALIRQYTVIF